jgi:hypothetical protein
MVREYFEPLAAERLDEELHLDFTKSEYKRALISTALKAFIKSNLVTNAHICSRFPIPFLLFFLFVFLFVFLFPHSLIMMLLSKHSLKAMRLSQILLVAFIALPLTAALPHPVVQKRDIFSDIVCLVNSATTLSSVTLHRQISSTISRCKLT